MSLCLCLLIIMGFTTAAWLLPLLKKERDAQRTAIMTEGPSGSAQTAQDRHRRSRRDAQDLTWLLCIAAQVSQRLAAFLGQRGGLSQTTCVSAFSDKLHLSLQQLVKKRRDFLNISQVVSGFPDWQPALLCWALPGSWVQGWRPVHCQKARGDGNSDQKAAGQREDKDVLGSVCGSLLQLGEVQRYIHTGRLGTRLASHACCKQWPCNLAASREAVPATCMQRPQGL